MKVEKITDKREGDEYATHVAGIKLIAESDLEQGILKKLYDKGVKITSRETGWASIRLMFPSRIEPAPTEIHSDYIAYSVKVHKDWLPMLQAMQEAGSFGTKKLKIEHIRDGFILRKLQDARDALSDIMLEVNAPKDQEE